MVLDLVKYIKNIKNDTKTWEIVELGSSGDFGKKLTGSYSMPEHFAVEN